MSFMVSEEVTVKEGGPRMMVKREAFHETDLVPGEGSRSAEEV